jgi:PPOX class probable F420-dependent enzyme
MSELTDELRGFLDAHRVGVLATTAPDGKPRQSVVYYARDGDRLLVTTLSTRLKAKDAERTGWVSLSVRGDEQPYPSATFAGSARILSEEIGPLTALIVQRITGANEPPEPQTDEALAAVDRVVLAVTVERVSAVTHLPEAAQSGET